MAEEDGGHSFAHMMIISVYDDKAATLALDFPDLRTVVYRLDGRSCEMEIRKAVLIFCGTLCVGLGVLGMFLPLMPTTVFLLLAAYCYSRSSERFHNWLMNNRFLGKYISSYQSGKGISVSQKISTISVLWISISASIWMLGSSFWITLLLLSVAIGVTVHLLWIKTYRPEVRTESIPVVAEADEAI